MISWIDKAYKDCYADSAKASGIRCKFHQYENDFDEATVEGIKAFIDFLRKNYYFPVRLNILFCNTTGFRHHADKHIYFGAFYSMDDERRKVYPRISIAAKVSERNSLEDVLFSLAHEITHYYQWVFEEENQRTSRSLEIEANRWAAHVINTYVHDFLSRYPC